MILRNAVNASIQRAKVYSENALQVQKKEFREDLKNWLMELGLRYFYQDYNEERYCNEILCLKNYLIQNHAPTLCDGNIKIGVCQKAITLYLKYFWLLGDDSKKPLFTTIDRGIMRDANVTNPPNWTELDEIEEYIRIVNQIEAYAINHGFESGAHWEAETWTDEDDVQP